MQADLGFHLDHARGDVSSSGKGQLNPTAAALQIILHRTARYSQHDGNLAGASSRFRQTAAFVVAVSWSAFSLPASKSPVHRGAFDAKVADPGGNVQCRKLADF
ncbi:hypothetical protein NKJ23_31150 [Mesorhizobium sp. M0184]|uniref:hypothetical protein n=1 Tax=Mesorhizobium sp. M0184 TaxID=2956906 RepID=UPI00333B1055